MFHYKLRRTIFIISAIIFFLIAIILIFYVQGFRYDFKNHRLTRAGMLIMQYYPKDAQVWVNDKLYQSSEGVSKINNLIPKDYTIRISRLGYQTWEKRLTVKSKLVTWANNVRLFPEEPTVKSLTLADLAKVSFSPNEKSVAYIDKNGILSIVDLNNANLNLIINQSDLSGYNIIDLVSWSPDNKKLIFLAKKGKNTHYFLVTLTNSNILSINNKLLITDLTPELKIDSKIIHPQSIQWFNQSGLLIKDKETVYKLDISKSLIKNSILPKVITNNVLNLKVKDEKIYFIQKETIPHTPPYLVLRTGTFKMITGNLNIESSIELPEIIDSNYKIMISEDNQLALLDSRNDNLFIINDEKPNLIAKDVQNAEWSQDSKKIAWQNEHEIWLYLLDEKRNELLTRYAEIIKKVIWYSDSSHLIFRVGDEIKVIEYNSINKPDIQNLTQISIDDTFIKCDKQDKYLYFLDKRESKATNLFQLNLE